jgi:hypothetical protein
VVGLAHTICPGLVGDQACSETDERPKPHYPTHSEWETRTLTSDMKMELD